MRLIVALFVSLTLAGPISFAQIDPLHSALSALDEGDLFKAEGELLSLSQDESQIARIGHYLAVIAVRFDTIDAKKSFYEKQLFHSRYARGTGLYVLAAFAAREHKWARFAELATYFLNEYTEDQHQFRYYPIYYLARYTDIRTSELNLRSSERLWFEACRALGQDKDVPAALEKVTFPFNALYLLQNDARFSLPSLTVTTSQASYFYGLLEVRQSLLEGELPKASQQVNEFMARKWLGERDDQKMWLYTQLHDLFLALGHPDQAQQMLRRSGDAKQRAVLPLVCWPAHLRMGQPELESHSLKLADKTVDTEDESQAIIPEPELEVYQADLDLETETQEESAEPETDLEAAEQLEIVAKVASVTETKLESIHETPPELTVTDLSDEDQAVAPELDPNVDAQPPQETGSMNENLETADKTNAELEIVAKITSITDSDLESTPEPATDVTVTELSDEQITIVGDKQSFAIERADLPPVLGENALKVEVPEQAVQVVVEPAIEPEIEKVDPVPSFPAVDPASGQQLSPAMSLSQMERVLISGNASGLSSALKGSSLDTPYKRIFATYLQGLSELNGGKYASAFGFLERAREEVAEVPFPLLECKILLALARAYDLERNRAQAEWFRIGAAQLINEPSAIPLLAALPEDEKPDPYALAIDAYLNQITREDMVSQVLYASELKSFINLRVQAYQRHALAANAIIGNQIEQIGKEMAMMVTGFAENANRSLSPRRYNQTLELWEQLWDKALPYFKDYSTPSVEALQEKLGDRGRALSFIEGDQLLGVIIISARQQFAIGLGPKAVFESLNAEAKLNFLESRIGPVWDYHGPLWISLSESFRDPAFVQTMVEHVLEPDQIRWIFSLRSLMSEPEVVESVCTGSAVFSENSEQAINDYVQQFPRSGLNWFADGASSTQQIRRHVPSHAHLVFDLEIGLSEQGLRLGTDENAFFLAELGALNQKLCSVTLIVDDLSNWPGWLDELALVQAVHPTKWLISQGVPTEILASEAGGEAYLQVRKAR